MAGAPGVSCHREEAGIEVPPWFFSVEILAKLIHARKGDGLGMVWIL
jgi:hypothetical protein